MPNENDETQPVPSAPDDKPLNILEGYAKATRNSLVWSSLTLLASVGVVWPIYRRQTPSDISLSWVAGGLAFPPLVVIGAFAGTAAFMYANWKRACRRNRLGNSVLNFAAAEGDATRALQRLREQVSNVQTAINRAMEMFELEWADSYEAGNTVSQLERKIEEKMRPVISKVEEFEMDLAKGIRDADFEMEDGKWRERIRPIITEIKMRLYKVSEGQITDIHTILKNIGMLRTTATESLIISATTAIDSIEYQISNFTKLHGNIAYTELKDEYWLVAVPVRGLWYCGSGASILAVCALALANAGYIETTPVNRATAPNMPAVLATSTPAS